MEMLRALGLLCEAPVAEHARIARALGLPAPPGPAEHTECFVFQLYPYASVYLGDAGMLGGDARDKIAGFWRALGMAPPSEPDHLAVMLSMYASLDEARRMQTNPRRKAAFESAQGAYFWEHLASWLFPYLDKVREVGSPFHRAWAALLAEALEREAAELGERAQLPLHLREASPFSGPDCSMSELLGAVLAPARSGMILVRDDLRRAARDLGLGVRQGERRFVLQALLAQDAPKTLDWLGHEAGRWAERHAERTGVIAQDWQRRARMAAEALVTLAELAGGAAAPVSAGAEQR